MVEFWRRLIFISVDYEQSDLTIWTKYVVHLRLSLMSLILFFYVEKCPRRFSVSPWVEGSAEELWTGILSHSIGTLWRGLKCWGSRKFFKIKRCIFFFFVPHPSPVRQKTPLVIWDYLGRFLMNWTLVWSGILFLNTFARCHSVVDL